ncbi:MAG: hypothetical protein HQL57_05910 [Magnetococcales bacterium]|nr:hypothetical protein [Magnetococcales bacterium]
MKSRLDFGLLKGSLIMLALSLLASVGLVVGGVFYQEEATREVEGLKARITELQQKKGRLESERRMLAEYLPRFQRYQAMGLIGAERRLQWVEAIREVESRLKLPAPVRFKLEPMREYVPPFPLEKGGFTIHRSRLSLAMGLLHEGDLFDFFDILSGLGRGLYTIDACAIRRTGAQATEKMDKLLVNLTVECEVNWYTLLEASESEG